MNYLHLISVVFVIAKIMGLITFSWWLVFLPSVISMGFVVFWIVFLALIAICSAD